MEAYIYTYVNKETNKTYIGSRSAYTGSCYDDFNIKYFSSSKDKQFRQDMADGKLEGQIVLVMNCEDANRKIVDVESKMITAYWDKYGKENSYNHHNNGSRWSTAGTTHICSDKTKMKISNILKGRKLSEEHKKKLSSAHQNPSAETRKRLSESHKGQKGPNKGGTISDEQKIAISNTLKNRIKPKWMTPTGEIREMYLSHVRQHHPDWVLVN